MAQTLAQITKQIEKLQKEADTLRQTELKGVVDRIKVAISHYGLTPDQLGFSMSAVKKSKVAKPTARNGNKESVPRFANEAGQVWSGRGPRPHWLREALTNGRSLKEFSTDPRQRAPKAAATTTQSSMVAEVAPPASATAKRTKSVAKKPSITTKLPLSSGEEVSGHAKAATASAPKAKHQLKTNLATSARAPKGPASKAPSVPVKTAPQTRGKRLKPVSARAKKAAVVPSVPESSPPVATPTGI